jgi:hypothetical protein
MRRPPTSELLRALRMRFRGAVRPVVTAFASTFDPRTLRGLAPFAVALVLAPFLAPAIRSNLKEPLFSDTLAFQYTGWCLRHGMRLYGDFGMTDGPFIHYLHALIQVFVGITDRGFRRADLSIEVFGSAVLGALLAPAQGPRTASRWVNRAAWAASAAAVWLSWYFTFGWEGTTQREAFYSIFGSVGMVLLFVSSDFDPRRAAIAEFLGAFLVTTQVFGKPTGVLYFAAGALCVLLPNAGASLTWRKRARILLVGSAACALAVVFLLAISGSFSGYVHWCVRTPYRSNRFLWGTDWHRLFLTVYWERFSRIAAGAFVAGAAAIGVGLLPPRAVGFVVLPPLTFLSACLQARGFDYHIIPMVASAHVVLLVILTRLWKLDDAREAPGERRERGVVAALALSFAGYYAFCNMQEARPRWGGDPNTWDAPEHESAEDEKKAGLYIKAHTEPDDFVFAYVAANAHVVLLSAERRTASPTYLVYWLDPVSLLPRSEVKPTAAEMTALVALQTDNRKDACASVLRHQPAAMAFDSLDMAYAVCPDVRSMLANDFGPPTTFGPIRVYLRKR